MNRDKLRQIGRNRDIALFDRCNFASSKLKQANNPDTTTKKQTDMSSKEQKWAERHYTILRYGSPRSTATATAERASTEATAAIATALAVITAAITSVSPTALPVVIRKNQTTHQRNHLRSGMGMVYPVYTERKLSVLPAKADNSSKAFYRIHWSPNEIAFVSSLTSSF